MNITGNTISSKAEFNEIYNHYHVGNYQATIQLVERYAPRETSDELLRSIYQSYRLLAFWALSDYAKLSEESRRLLEITNDSHIKILFKSFNLLSTLSKDELYRKVKSIQSNGEDEKISIISHFISIIYCCLLTKENQFCQIVDLLLVCTEQAIPHFELEK